MRGLLDQSQVLFKPISGHREVERRGCTVGREGREFWIDWRGSVWNWRKQLVQNVSGCVWPSATLVFNVRSIKKSSSVSRLVAVFSPWHITVLRGGGFACDSSVCSYVLEIMDGQVLEAAVVAGQEVNVKPSSSFLQGLPQSIWSAACQEVSWLCRDSSEYILNVCIWEKHNGFSC